MGVTNETLRFRPVRCATYTRQSVVRSGDPAVRSCAIQYDLCAEFVRSTAVQLW